LNHQQITVVLSRSPALLYTQTSPYRARELFRAFFLPQGEHHSPTNPSDRAAIQAVPGYHRDTIYIKAACTQSDGRYVLAIHRRYKEQPHKLLTFGLPERKISQKG